MTGAQQDTAGSDSATLMRRSAAQGPAAVAADAALARKMRRRGEESRLWWLVPTIYIIFLLLPIYWLLNMSFKTNQEITAAFTLWPREFTWRNYTVSSDVLLEKPGYAQLIGRGNTYNHQGPQNLNGYYFRVTDSGG